MSLTQTLVEARGRFTPQFAVAYASPGGEAIVVDAQSPLPVHPASASTTPLTGTVGGVAISPEFISQPGHAVWVALSGTWTGEVTLQRSTDAGATWAALTIAGNPWGRFRNNACEPVSVETEAGVRYRLDCALVSGTVTYRVSQ